MSYSTEKRKILKLWNKSDNVQFLVRENKRQNEIILTRVDSLNRTSLSFEKFTTLTTDWVTPKTSLFAIPGTPVDSYYESFKLVINSIEEKYIPYFKSEIFFRIGDAEISAPVPKAENDPEFDFDVVANINKNETIEVVQSSILTKDVTYRSSIYLERTIQSGILPDNLQFKIVFYLYNPSHYQDI